MSYHRIDITNKYTNEKCDYCYCKYDWVSENGMVRTIGGAFTYALSTMEVYSLANVIDDEIVPLSNALKEMGIKLDPDSFMDGDEM